MIPSFIRDIYHPQHSPVLIMGKRRCPLRWFASPPLLQAGKSTVSTEPGTHACLRFEERPPTPEKEKRWRVIQEPGARIRHPGVVRPESRILASLLAILCSFILWFNYLVVCACSQRADAVDDSAVYGDYQPRVDSVSTVMKAGHKKPLEEYLTGKGEVRFGSLFYGVRGIPVVHVVFGVVMQEVYRSTKREPLGKSMSRGVDVSHLTSKVRPSNSICLSWLLIASHSSRISHLVCHPHLLRPRRVCCSRRIRRRTPHSPNCTRSLTLVCCPRSDVVYCDGLTLFRYCCLLQRMHRVSKEAVDTIGPVLALIRHSIASVRLQRCVASPS